MRDFPVSAGWQFGNSAKGSRRRQRGILKLRKLELQYYLRCDRNYGFVVTAIRVTGAKGSWYLGETLALCCLIILPVDRSPAVSGFFK